MVPIPVEILPQPRHRDRIGIHAGFGRNESAHHPFARHREVEPLAQLETLPHRDQCGPGVAEDTVCRPVADAPDLVQQLLDLRRDRTLAYQRLDAVELRRRPAAGPLHSQPQAAYQFADKHLTELASLEERHVGFGVHEHLGASTSGDEQRLKRKQEAEVLRPAGKLPDPRLDVHCAPSHRPKSPGP
jgi:hypothetical protein